MMSNHARTRAALPGLGRAACAALAAGVLSASAASAQTMQPAAIDRAVAAFTGAPIGAEGGALKASDPRLRLAQCSKPLDLSWHGRAQSLVRVACEGARSWQIFVATKPRAAAASAPIASAGSATTRVASTPKPPAIKRGDPLTVVVRGNGFSVQQPGEAGENGRVGEWIAVRTARGREPVRALLERPGLAIIEMR